MGKKARALTIFFVGIFVLFIPSFRSFAQMQEPIQLITEINLRIDEMPAGTEMRNLVPMQVGEVYSLKKITESIKQIYQTGLFSDVRVLREGTTGTKLTYLLKRKLFIRRIDFVGGSKLPRRKLLENLDSLKEEGSYSEESLNRAVEEIRNILSRT